MLVSRYFICIGNYAEMLELTINTYNMRILFGKETLGGTVFGGDTIW